MKPVVEAFRRSWRDPERWANVAECLVFCLVLRAYDASFGAVVATIWGGLAAWLVVYAAAEVVLRRRERRARGIGR